jgi:hypothetical protein
MGVALDRPFREFTFAGSDTLTDEIVGHSIFRLGRHIAEHDALFDSPCSAVADLIPRGDHRKKSARLVTAAKGATVAVQGLTVARWITLPP